MALTAEDRKLIHNTATLLGYTIIKGGYGYIHIIDPDGNWIANGLMDNFNKEEKLYFCNLKVIKSMKDKYGIDC